MTTIKRLASALAFAFCASVIIAQAQTPQMTTVNITPDPDRVRISAVGNVSEMRVEVSDESGEVVFQSGAITGTQLVWNMTDAEGGRVSPGTYLVTVTFRNGAGKLRKRVEQVTVEESEKASARPTPEPQAVQATITGAGANGKIAKFTGGATIGNSVITETGGNIGIGAPPLSGWRLDVNGPARVKPHAAGDIRFSTPNFETGMSILRNKTDTTPAGRADVRFDGETLKLVALRGTGVPPSTYGLAITTTGRVGIGTTDPVDRLTVHAPGSYGFTHTNGYIHLSTYVGESSSGATGGWLGTKSYHPLYFFTGGSQPQVMIDTTGRVGIGTLTTSRAMLEINAAQAGGVYVTTGNNIAVYGETSGDIAVEGKSTSSIGVFGVSETREGVWGTSESGAGVRGSSPDGYGVQGFSSENTGVIGESAKSIGVFGKSYSATNVGVYGENTKGGWAGYFKGKLEVVGTFVNNSDRHQKANVSPVDSRLILQRLSTIPIQAWNYNTEPASIRHLGPMAQDFRAAFGLGIDEKTISPVDTNGVALASIQALYQMMQEKDRQIMRQRRQITQLETRLARVERAARKNNGHRRRAAR
jgi:hypothetical protein